METIMSLLYLLNEMSVYLLLGCLIAGILHVFAPLSFYRHYLSKNNFNSVVNASLFGIPLPLCSCGVIPTAMSLRREGASKGATVAFLTSTPQTGVDSILATYSVLGLPLAIMRPIAAFITSLFSGVLVNRMAAGKEQSEEVTPAKEIKEKIGNRFVAVFRYGYYDLLQDIGGHLLLGLVIAGLITLFIPDQVFLLFTQNTFLEMAVILVISIPMYVCATGSIPIAAALMLKGVSPGAALVFLMAGPATNMASLLVIRKIMGMKTMLIYLVSIVVGAFVFGYAIDSFFPREWFAVAKTIGESGHPAPSLFNWIMTVLFLVLLFYALLTKKRNKTNITNTMENERIYHVGGLCCNHCKASVERELSQLKNAESVTVDLGKGEVAVKGNVNEQKVKEVIESLGFEYKG